MAGIPDNIAFTLLLVAAAVFLGWFAVGTHLNVRKGNQVLSWIQTGLPLLGERTTMRWLGSSVVELKIAKARTPFRNVETLAVFEPRDVPILWAISRQQGRRDMLIFRAQMENTPAFELEVFDPKGWTTHDTERDLKKKNWTALNLGAGSPLLAYFSGSNAVNSAKPVIDLASQAGGSLVRLSLHRTIPNLEMHVRMPDLKSQSAQNLFQRIKQIAQDTSR
jgi:hypothetical protein